MPDVTSLTRPEVHESFSITESKKIFCFPELLMHGFFVTFNVMATAAISRRLSEFELLSKTGFGSSEPEHSKMFSPFLYLHIQIKVQALEEVKCKLIQKVSIQPL